MEADLDGNGKVEFGEALPDANIFLPTMRDFYKMRASSTPKANAFEPSDSDAFSALVIMTPTMSEYFEAWKNSRFVSGGNASEQAFVATSRLSDIAHILRGSCHLRRRGAARRRGRPAPGEADGGEPHEASRLAADLRDKDEQGKMYTAEQADTLGSQAQEQAEAIAGQITQAAAKLNIELEEG